MRHVFRLYRQDFAAMELPSSLFVSRGSLGLLPFTVLCSSQLLEQGSDILFLRHITPLPIYNSASFFLIWHCKIAVLALVYTSILGPCRIELTFLLLLGLCQRLLEGGCLSLPEGLSHESLMHLSRSC
jgi:hypothetical protein